MYEFAHTGSALAREPSPRPWDGQSYFKTGASILEDRWINDTRRVNKWYKMGK